MNSPERHGTSVTSFDPRTAGAVVMVLNRAGIPAWVVRSAEIGSDQPADADADVEVMVAEGDRERALAALGARMDEVRDAARDAAEDARPTRRRTDDHRNQPTDPDDVHSGPPLVMERFRSLSWVLAILLVPLMVVTLAPTIRSEWGLRVAVAVGLVVIGIIVVRRRR